MSASLIGTAVGLGVTVAALGLAFDLVDKTTRRTQESIGQPRRKQSKRSEENIFDLGLTQQPRRSSKKKFSNDFGSDFNIFAI